MTGGHGHLIGRFVAEGAYQLLAHIVDEFAGSSVRISPFYLATTVLIAYVVFRTRSTEGHFIAWLFPMRIVLHPSHATDVKLYVVGRLLHVVGMFGAVSLTTLVAACVMTGIGHDARDAAWHPVPVAVLLAVVNDFGTYWVHRWHHTIRAIWPFHAVHHSAEVLTPLTVYRKHPIYDVFSVVARSALIGLLQGMLLALFVGRIEIAAIAGANAVYVLFHLTGSNLRHSHLWLRYGKLLEHVLISPAQHQVHHSRAPQHQDKNYGEVLAIWDWMFGTLYVPADREDLDFGLADEAGRALPQPHGSLRQALLVPFRDAWLAVGPARRHLTRRARIPDE